MKIIILLYLFFLSTAFAQWEILAPSPITESLSAPAFINQEKGFVSAGSGSLYKTSDGFKSFVKVPTGVGGRIYRSQFTDELNGYLIMRTIPGLEFELIKTTDGGDSWNKLTDSLLFRPMAFSFINKDTGWVSTWDKVLFTSNGGDTWEVRLYAYLIVKFTDQFNGWGTAGDAFKTTDGGYTWQPLSFAGIVMQDVVVQSDQSIMLVGKNSYTIVLSITFDGGINWTQVTTPFPSSNSFDQLPLFEDSTIIFSFNRYSRRSDDLGSNWESIIPTPPFNQGTLGNYCFKDKHYFFGAGGLIVSSTDGINWNNIGSELGGVRIVFVDQYNGFTAPWYSTTDGGNNWELKEELIPDYTGLYDFYFFTPSRGIFSNYNRLYQTTDGGKSWDTLFTAEETFLRFIFVDSLYGYAHMLKYTGNQQYVNGIRKTTDGGYTWDDFIGVYLGDHICFASRELGFASNAEGFYGCRTTDGGITWYPNQFGRSYYISMIDSQTGFGTTSSGNKYQLLMTTDAGNTYNILNEDIPVTYIYFIDQLNGWGTNQDKIYRTADGGITWELEFQGMLIRQFYLHEPDQLFAVGAFGALLKRDGPLSNTQSSEPGIPVEFKLYQNYPNPFNPSTTISYQISEKTFVSLKIYDVLGNLISELVNEEKLPGTYKTELNKASLVSGVYFYRIKAGSFTQTRKMILMK